MYCTLLISDVRIYDNNNGSLCPLIKNSFNLNHQVTLRGSTCMYTIKFKTMWHYSVEIKSAKSEL